MAFEKTIKDDILDSLAEGIFTVNKEFKINFFNKAAEKITGYNREEVMGKFCKHVFKSRLCFHDCPIAMILKTKKNIYDFDSEMHLQSGDKIPIKLNAAVLYNDDKEPSGGIISFRDICDLEVIRKNLVKDSHFHGVIGKSKQMRDIFDLIDEIADSDAPVMIHGESGTGKEMIANAIQMVSGRRDNPFIKVNCSVFPPHLLSSELFGHVKGAFTDAFKDRPGRFELADGGTIFLDEVAEMPSQMQRQLLRVLQEGTFERVGESVTRKVNVRVISATNLNLQEALKTGILREDLFYRLNVIPIEIPPLRERMDDLAPLVNHFLKKFSLLYKKEILDIDDNALDLLQNYSFPGNIRELENAIEYAFVRTANSSSISFTKLPANIKYLASSNNNAHYISSSPLSKKTELISLLEKHHWNKTKAAQELKIGRTTLWRRLKDLGIEK